MTKNYDQDFKNSIVKMVNDGGNPKDLAEEYGPHYQTIFNWVKKSKKSHSPEGVLEKANKRIKELEQENDILKSAAIIFAKY